MTTRPPDRRRRRRCWRRRFHRSGASAVRGQGHAGRDALCYVLYTSINWPGISTSVVTCIFTALTTVGASRQKQVLRFLGAVLGGFVFAMGAQVFLFPTSTRSSASPSFTSRSSPISAWIMTSSPRLSYMGVQMALAFYLVHLQTYRFETSLTIARDRVVGILVGLLAMWLIFDQMWGSPAGVAMKKTFIANLHLLAQLARATEPGDRAEAVHRAYSLGQTINANFDQVKSLGDGVLFEFGPSRAADLKPSRPDQPMAIETARAVSSSRSHAPLSA